MSFSPLIEQLINALRCLPGVGPRSAQRMALYILENARDNGLHLANVLKEAIEKVDHCQECHTLSETSLCRLCQNPNRNELQLCIVETPADVMAIEQTAGYRGKYFVLMGHLSPLDGIGPEQLGIAQLAQRLDQGTLEEVILATNPTVEGEATAHYLADLIKQRNITVTRIAYGVPIGGELEFVDGNTLTRAFYNRQPIE